MPEDNHHIDQSMIDPRRRDRAENERIECALEVERLDVNLYRSRSLYVPYRARGVFGGQVISQAIVSATKCVDPAFALHVRYPLSHCNVWVLIQTCSRYMCAHWCDYRTTCGVDS
jgi:hypothetical protein